MLHINFFFEFNVLLIPGKNKDQPLSFYGQVYKKRKIHFISKAWLTVINQSETEKENNDKKAKEEMQNSAWEIRGETPPRMLFVDITNLNAHDSK